MPVRRPGSVTAAGVLAIIYGSLGLLCGLCGVIGIAAQGAMGPNFMAGAGGDPQQVEVQKQIQDIQKQVQDALERDLPGYKVIQLAGPFVSLLIAALLLIGGIGLLSMGRWARTLTLAASWIGIAYLFFQIIYQSAMVMPTANDALQAVVLPPMAPGGPPPEEMMKVARTFVDIMFVVMMVFYVLFSIYLLIIVWLLSRRHVRIAFANNGQTGYEGRPLLEEQDRLRHEHDDRQTDWENR